MTRLYSNDPDVVKAVRSLYNFFLFYYRQTVLSEIYVCVYVCVCKNKELFCSMWEEHSSNSLSFFISLLCL